MPRYRRDLEMTAYKFKDEEDARYEKAKQAVVKLFVKHKQQDLLPMLGLEIPAKKGKESG